MSNATLATAIAGTSSNSNAVATLGQTAALLLSGDEAEWTIKKGALWWFSNRTRQGETQTVLRAVIGPDLAG